MATIKSYTDISQAKVLAKILPHESADMYYFRQIDNDYFPSDVESICPIPLFKDGKEDFNYDIRCWSLSALISVLPKNLNIGRPSLESNYNGYYWIQYYDEFMKPNNYRTECFNNPVDACVDMILKLNGLNML